MRLLTDLHVHSVASGHAFSTVGELAQSASERGLELIAVTDHGPALPGAAHLWYFSNLKIVPSVYRGVRILKGVEANLVTDTDNGLDLDDETLAKLDLVSVGVHPGCGWDGAGESRTTEALLRVMENPLVDMVTHAGNPWFPMDVGAIAEAAVRHGVLIEINNASYDPAMARAGDIDRELSLARAASDSGALVAICSDAHFHTRVGVFEQAIAVAEEAGITLDRIVSRDAATVMAHLATRRERPRLDWGGEV